MSLQISDQVESTYVHDTIPVTPKPVASVLARVGEPADLRSLTRDELDVLAAEIRGFLVHNVRRTGGHLGSNLGVVELTIALHRVFDSPRDSILWDTGHQAYVHKVLTGRAGAFTGLRQAGGLSGYPSRTESEHDLIESSHASTALSWADGLTKAHELTGVMDRRVVVVVGDGALTGGVAWEAMNNIAASNRPVVVVLNDNGRSYSPTVGGIATHLAELRASERRSQALHVVGDAGEPHSVFTALGMAYLGPVDGHDTQALETALQQASAMHRPVVVHCKTDKGRGFPEAERHEEDRMHAVSPASPVPTVGTLPQQQAMRSWTSVFAGEITAIGTERDDVVAVTAAMLHPVGLGPLARTRPERVFDVGIAEQHAVASAAGLALGGMHPVVAVYATFLNRAFDQVLMDVALHKAGVTFVLDRAGVTGDDGASHNGMWDLSLLGVVPGIRVAVPRDAAALCRQLRTAVDVSDGPTVIRFPKGAVGADLPAIGWVGGMEVLYRTGDPLAPSDVLLVPVGPMARTGLSVARRLAEAGIGVTVVDPGWVLPVDSAMAPLAARHKLVVTVEDNVRAGGVGCAVAQALRDADVDVPVREFGVPREFLPHGTRAALLADAGLSAAHLTRMVEHALTRVTSRSGR